MFARLCSGAGIGLFRAKLRKMVPPLGSTRERVRGMAGRRRRRDDERIGRRKSKKERAKERYLKEAKHFATSLREITDAIENDPELKQTFQNAVKTIEEKTGYKVDPFPVAEAEAEARGDQLRAHGIQVPDPTQWNPGQTRMIPEVESGGVPIDLSQPAETSTSTAFSSGPDRESIRSYQKTTARVQRIKEIVSEYLKSPKNGIKISPKGNTQAFGLYATDVDIVDIQTTGKSMHVITWHIAIAPSQQSGFEISGQDHKRYRLYLDSLGFNKDYLNNGFERF
ncbi:hypothetical protein AAMO2058_000736700 [Amorphochlora amoebiformis]